MKASFIEVDAGVRYWEDAMLDGDWDHTGEIPLRDGERWKPVINLQTGHIMAWPEGVEADVHYKVCDDGEYWLLDDTCRRIAKWKGYYVPNDFLCVGDNGYGDYIIFKVGGDGAIIGWRNPGIDTDQWETLNQKVDNAGV
jgi:hypothetical protein